MRVPTCDDADRPILKGAIHVATAALYIVMAIYHVAAAVTVHWCPQRKGGS